MTGFKRNVLMMFAGTASGQLIAILFSPILTRIYSPEAFGVLGAFSAVAAIASVVAALRYEMALPLVKEESANLLVVCGVALLATMACAYAIISLIPSSYLGVLAPYKYLLPLAMVLIGAYQVLVYAATAERAFSAIAKTKLYQGFIGPISQIILASMGVLGLVIGFIFGQSAGVINLYMRLPKTVSTVSLAGMRNVARTFIRFPLISSWSGLINTAGGSMLLLAVMPMLYSTAIAGFVFLVDRVIGRPLMLVSTSIMQVYMGDIAAKNMQDIRRRFLQVAGFQCAVVAGWLALINIAAPFLFAPVFGEEWGAAVPYLQVLSIAYLPQMVMHALTHTLQILQRQALSALWEIGRFIAVVGALYCAYINDLSALDALFYYSVVQAGAQLALFFLMLHSLQSE